MAPHGPPRRVRQVDSTEGVKALADPLRMKILRLLMSNHDRSWTVKELAAELDEPATKLYHHVNVLAQAELIRDVETRMVSGIVEHRYASAQRRLEFDDKLYSSPEARDASLANVANLVNASRDSLLDYLATPDADLGAVMIHHGRVRLTAEEAAQFRQAVAALVEDLLKHRQTKARKSLPRTEVLVLVNPEPQH